MTKQWTVPEGMQKPKKRKARGSGSGMGKTASRGHKGQRARSGASPRSGFEGGQTPIYRRLPKRGFTNIFRDPAQVVNVEQLATLPSDVSQVTPRVLWKNRLITKLRGRVKLLGRGELTRAFTIQLHQCSKTAQEKVQSAGGKVEELVLE